MTAVEDDDCRQVGKTGSRPVVEAGESAMPPNDRPRRNWPHRVKAGRMLFYGTKANCVKCHGRRASATDSRTTTTLDQGRSSIRSWTPMRSPTRSRPTQTSLAELDGEALATAAKSSWRQSKESGSAKTSRRDCCRRGTDSAQPAAEHVPRGRRPIDLYCRGSDGIEGVPMPAAR